LKNYILNLRNSSVVYESKVIELGPEGIRNENVFTNLYKLYNQIIWYQF